MDCENGIEYKMNKIDDRMVELYRKIQFVGPAVGDIACAVSVECDGGMEIIIK